MHSHDGTWDFMKMLLGVGFIILAIWWLTGAIGEDYTVLFVFAMIGVFIFAGGALFAQANQKMTLNAITKFNAQDAQIDKMRMQSFKTMSSGEAAMQKAAAQMTVIDAKRVDKLASQQAKMLTSNTQPAVDEGLYTWDVEESEDVMDDWS